MDINTLENVREAVHASSLILLFVVVLVATIGTFKPNLLRGVLKEFAERKYILAGAVFICLLCGTIFTATQNMSRPYESSRTQTSNTAGSLEQPSRQVSGQTSDPGEEGSSGNPGFTQSEEVLGAVQTSQPQAVAQAPAPSQQESRSSGTSTSNTPQQQPAQTPTPSTPPPTPNPPSERCVYIPIVGKVCTNI